MMEGLDDSFDAVIFIGYHAKAGHPGGLFAHTGSGVVRDVRVNGQLAGRGRSEHHGRGVVRRAGRARHG